jgi:hypothetical protein
MHKTSSASKKKVLQYLDECLKLGCITTPWDERSPFYCATLFDQRINKKRRLEAHLKAKHGAYINYDLNQFKSLKGKFEKRSTTDSLLPKIVLLELVLKFLCS